MASAPQRRRFGTAVPGLAGLRRLTCARLLILLCLFSTAGARAAGAAIPPTPAPATLPSRLPPVDFDTAASWYRHEFGDQLPLERLKTLYEAHLWVEAYFTDLPTQAREQVIRQIETSGVTPADVARLCRIRLGWRDVEPGVYYIHDRIGPTPVYYFVGVPEGYTPARPWPAVLMLPTATAFVARRPVGEVSGDEVARTYTRWLQAELRARPGYLFIMPLLHLTELWGPGYAGMNNAIRPLLHANETFAIDPRRVYLRGQGMSGHAVWNLALHYPTYFAAVNPLAGGASYDWQRARLINLRNTLPVVWHDRDDPAVPVKASRDLVAVLRQNRIDVLYEETRGVGHIPGPELDQRLFTQMTGRTKDPFPRVVSLRSNRMDLAFLRNDWVQVWEPADPGQETRHVFRWGGSSMWTFQNVLTLEARLSGPRGTASGNRIELQARNVGSVRLLLSDELVDLSRPVSVVWNNRTLFEGPVEASHRATLTDQLLLGRGWRTYTAALDLTLTPAANTAPATAPASPSSPPPP